MYAIETDKKMVDTAKSAGNAATTIQAISAIMNVASGKSMNKVWSMLSN